MRNINLLYLLLFLTGQILITSCGDDDTNDPDPTPEPTYTVPTTYVFTDADGNNTVSYSGQTARLDMLEEITSYMKTGNTSGTPLDATTLNNMFTNSNYTWSASDLNSTTKQLGDRLISRDASKYVSFFDSIATSSLSADTATDGIAGVVYSNSGTKSYLVSANGIEYTQIIEKGLMGDVLFDQMVNKYLTEDRIGPAVGTTPVDAPNGKYYSDKEHHFDEAFGYFGAPIDWPTNVDDDRFIAKYSHTVNSVLATDQKLMDAYLKARAAISNGDETARLEAVEVLYEQLELVFAGAAIHYLNLANSNAGDPVLMLHELSEAWAFMGALSISPKAKTTQTELDAWYAEIGTNFWKVVDTNVISVRNQIASKYGISSTDRNAL